MGTCYAGRINHVLISISPRVPSVTYGLKPNPPRSPPISPAPPADVLLDDLVKYELLELFAEVRPIALDETPTELDWAPVELDN